MKAGEHDDNDQTQKSRSEAGGGISAVPCFADSIDSTAGGSRGKVNAKGDPCRLVRIARQL